MNIQPPDWLSPEAKTVFVTTAQLMGKALQDTDESLLADFAMAQCDVIRLQGIVDFVGDTVTGTTGNVYINPTLTILMARRKDLAQLRHDLKLTPRARNATVKNAGAGALKAAMK